MGKPKQKHGFGPKNFVNPLNNLDQIWLQMRNVLINRYVVIHTQDGGYKNFKIVEINLRFPLNNSIIYLN